MTASPPGLIMGIAKPADHLSVRQEQEPRSLDPAPGQHIVSRNTADPSRLRKRNGQRQDGLTAGGRLNLMNIGVQRNPNVPLGL